MRSIPLVRTSNDALHRLRGFDGTVEQAVALILPPSADLSETAAAIETAETAVREADKDLARMGQLISDISKRIADAVRLRELPAPEQLSLLREERDRLLADLVDAAADQRLFSAKQAIALRDRVLEIDRLHELRHSHHDLVLRRESDQRELAQAEGVRVNRGSQEREAMHSQHWMKPRFDGHSFGLASRSRRATWRPCVNGASNTLKFWI
jgi:septal ring factor EnvC (AmiA/AmiB activator)